MDKTKILHIASFNGNIGDNANHNGLRRKLREYLGSNIKYDEIEMREFYLSWNIRDFNSKEFIDLANQYNLIIIGGGNFFELKWDYSHTGTTVNISKETLEKIKTPIFFFGLGCDVAKGASQQSIKKFDEFLQVVTSSNKYMVTVRNDGSFNTIKDLYGDKYDNKIYKVIDGAFFLESKSYEFPELRKNSKSIGVNVVSDMKDIRFNKNLRYEEFIEGTAKVLNNFLKENKNYQIILFPHIYSDLEAIYKLLKNIDDLYRRKRVVVAPCLLGAGSEEYIFGLYKKCDFILGMRFHSNVCGIAQNIPTIALSSYKKITDLYSELNLIDRVIDVNEKGFEKKLKKEIENTKDNSEKIKQIYETINIGLNKEANDFYEELRIWAKENHIL